MRRLLKMLWESLGGRVAMAMLALLALNAGTALAQATTTEADQVTVILAPALSSVAAVITASIFGTYLVKRLLVDVPFAESIPLWVYVILISMILTVIANKVVHSLEGALPYLLWQAVYNAAAASGLREWVYSGLSKPMKMSAAGI